jgi:hypothetical protein
LAEAFHLGHREARRGAGGTEEARAAWLEHAFKGSSEAAAHHVAIKLAAAQRMGSGTESEAFSTAARDALARMEHNRYVAERLLEGWRFGPRNDVEKLRESLCAWDHLSVSEQEKDYEQVALLEEWWLQSPPGGMIR